MQISGGPRTAFLINRRRVPLFFEATPILLSPAISVSGGAFVWQMDQSRSVMSRSDRMKLTTLTAAFAAMLLFAQSAQARAHPQHWPVAHRDAGSRVYAAQSGYR